MGCGSSTTEVNIDKPFILLQEPEEEEENTENPYRFLKTKNYDNGANYTNGKKQGGKIIYSNGNYYQGEENKGKREGKGIEYYKNGGIKYDGYWSNDLPEGEGKFIDKKGHYYIGPFKQGLKHGKGVEYYPNGEKKYEGDFVNGKKEGKGIYRYDLDDVGLGYYVGFLKNDKFEGKGQEYFKNGKINFDGYYANGTLNGYGKLYNQDGIWIEGEWKNGLLNGKGKRYSKEGKLLYDGDMVLAKPEGYGKLMFDNDPHSYEGEFKNGFPNGKGKEYLNGKLVAEGIFEDGITPLGNRIMYCNRFESIYLYPVSDDEN